MFITKEGIYYRVTPTAFVEVPLKWFIVMTTKKRRAYKRASRADSVSSITRDRRHAYRNKHTPVLLRTYHYRGFQNAYQQSSTAC